MLIVVHLLWNLMVSLLNIIFMIPLNMLVVTTLLILLMSFITCCEKIRILFGEDGLEVIVSESIEKEDKKLILNDTLCKSSTILKRVKQSPKSGNVFFIIICISLIQDFFIQICRLMKLN